MKLDSRVFKFKQNLQRASILASKYLGTHKYQPGQYEKVNLNVTVSNLGESFQDYKIIHLTDIHLGYWMSPERLEGLVHEVNQLEPDLVVITGDYVSYIVDELLEDLYQSLNKLQAKDGVVSVLGNHDHWMGAHKVLPVLQKAGVINLINDSFTITKGEDSLHIAGIDDAMVFKDDLNQVLHSLPQDNHPAILLAHEPDFADQASNTERFFLQLSGHSHGGQISLPLLGSPIRGPWFKKYPAGKYQVGNMLQYTNRGVGTNAFQFRINCKPEITQINLKTATIN